MGNFLAPNPNKSDLKKLLKSGGGEVLAKPPPYFRSTNSNSFGDKIFILSEPEYLKDSPQAPNVEKQYGRKALNFLWILDSISNYELLNIEEYKIEQD